MDIKQVREMVEVNTEEVKEMMDVEVEGECLTMMVFLIPLSPPTKLKFPPTITNSDTLYKVQGLSSDGLK